MPIHLNLHKKRVAVHQIGPCPGCQQTLLQPSAELLRMGRLLDLHHCLQGADSECHADVALVTGCVHSAAELARLQRIRSNSLWLVAVGSCSSADGLAGLQASTALADHVQRQWPPADVLMQLQHGRPLSACVQVDVQLWGCPIHPEQVLDCVRSLLIGVRPPVRQDSVCAECQLHGHACLPVMRQQPCLGPVTRAGCQARCIAGGQGCYGCFGRIPGAAMTAMRQQLRSLGLDQGTIEQRLCLLDTDQT